MTRWGARLARGRDDVGELACDELLERRRRDIYIAWGVSPRNREYKIIGAPGGGDRFWLRREPQLLIQLSSDAGRLAFPVSTV